jgi:hypothetical protein
MGISSLQVSTIVHEISKRQNPIIQIQSPYLLKFNFIDGLLPSSYDLSFTKNFHYPLWNDEGIRET